MREDLIRERKEKKTQLEHEGVSPYPARTKRSHTIEGVLSSFTSLKKTQKKVSVVGRILSIRKQGKIIFLDIEDATGSIQGILQEGVTRSYKLYKKTLDGGDLISVTGTLFTTKSKQKSIQVTTLQILNKALRPLPSQYYGLEDTETRLRKRYLDALMNPEVRELFEKKARFWSASRSFLQKEGFLEVDTPILEHIPGGAEAEPFITHHNALDTDFYLRISLEISLKKMLVAGFEKIFEIGRIFRNEGIDAEHLQDYTQLEFYWAYSDYNELMKFARKMYLHIIKETFGTHILSHDGKKIDWKKPWKVVSYCDAFKKEVGIDPRDTTQKELYTKARALGITQATSALGKGRLIDLIYKKTIRPKLIHPSFLIDPPVEIEPLAKRSEKDPRVVERFQIVAYGTELGKGFSEANDPEDQRKRFEEQMRLREKGDNEAQMLDEDFLEALEYGMPPAAGFGFSERLFSVLAQRPIRETVFFPPMRKDIY